MAGLLIARAIAEGDDEYRRFAAFPPRWAGGPFGRLGVQSSYWMMQMRDGWTKRNRGVEEKEESHDARQAHAVAVIGNGIIGHGVAQIFAMAGKKVTPDRAQCRQS